MNNRFSRAALILGAALTFSATSFAQESKVKIERDDYELKVKQEGDEYKMKEKGRRPTEQKTQPMMIHRQGETVTTVKQGEMPKTQAVASGRSAAVKKKSYASKKNCTCKTTARKPAAKKRSVAYKPKAKTTTRTATASTLRQTPVVVRDTVFITRVDTVFSINEQASFTGNRVSGERMLRDDFKKMKIKKDGDEIELKKEYENGEKVKKTFQSEDDYNTYMEWKNY